MFMCLLNSSPASLHALLYSTICGPDDPAGMFGFCPGFAGGTNGIVDKVACTAGFIVKNISPNCPLPLFECTDAAFVFSFKCNSARLSHAGCPIVGGIEGCRKFSVILSELFVMFFLV